MLARWTRVTPVPPFVARLGADTCRRDRAAECICTQVVMLLCRWCSKTAASVARTQVARVRMLEDDLDELFAAQRFGQRPSARLVEYVQW